MPAAQPVDERMDRYTRSRPRYDCWLWDGAFNINGYGRIWFDNRFCYAHRVQWVRFYGPIPDGLLVCHTCDVKRCVNPEHLFLGTYKDNMQDASKKQRLARRKGEDHPRSKLTEAQVYAIRKDNRKQKPIAKDYGVTICTISAIKSHHLWGHLPW